VSAPLRIALLGAVAFLVVLLARLPASWIVPRSGPVGCDSVEGSVWNGSCGGVTLGGAPWGDVSWEVAPLRLLAGRLAAHVTLRNGPVTGSGDVARGFFGGSLEARKWVADLPIDPRRLPHVPPQLRGNVHADLALARVTGGAIVELQGRIEVHDLTRRTGHVTQLGSYALTFPGGGGEPLGTLADLGGPLAVHGTLRLTKQPGYVLEGQVAPREGASPELLDDLKYLGSPDGLGRRPLSVAGTL
jgi:hypothetical protein